MKVFIICLCLVAVFASEPEEYGPPAPKNEVYTQEKVVAPVAPAYKGPPKQHYMGMYSGKCGSDGFYYMSEYSLMICSNGNAYEQKCALGTKNSGFANYASGMDYYIHDFCDVNLVDYGFNVPKEPAYKPKEPAYKPEPKQPAYPTENVVEYAKPAPKAPVYTGKSVYIGVYGGSCSTDGFYYNNEDSFVICSNGNAYVQGCAPGSKNSGYNQYKSGSDYSYHDFCDINLVDYGYNAYQGYPGYHAYPSYVPSPKFFYRW